MPDSLSIQAAEKIARMELEMWPGGARLRYSGATNERHVFLVIDTAAQPAGTISVAHDGSVVTSKLATRKG